MGVWGTAAGLWAIHLSDGVLSAGWCLGGYALAALFLVLGSWRLRDEEIPQLALLTAAFFVGSFLHVPLGPTSVHLLLTGLIGVLLGWRAALAVPLALFLQAVLAQHGGLSTLGVNSCIMILPAWGAGLAFRLLHRPTLLQPGWRRSALVVLTVASWTAGLCACLGLLWPRLAEPFLGHPGESVPAFSFPTAVYYACRPPSLVMALVLGLGAAWLERRAVTPPEFPLGLLLGTLAVLATTGLNCLVLLAGGEENWHTLSLLLFLAHLPVALVEGLVLGFTLGLLARAKPELLGKEPVLDPPKSLAASAEGAAASVSEHCWLLAVGLLGLGAAPARAHVLHVECQLLANQQVQVSCWYSARPQSVPARQARVRVWRQADQQLLWEGQTDDQGLAVFPYPRVEPLVVEAYQAGHRAQVILFAEDRGTKASPVSPSSPAEGPPPAAAPPAAAPAQTWSSWQQQEQPLWRDLLLGVSFLLALAAFVLSVRTAQRLRQERPAPPR
jgi:ABC-type Co2+ transport system permease subunit